MLTLFPGLKHTSGKHQLARTALPATSVTQRTHTPHTTQRAQPCTMAHQRCRVCHKSVRKQTTHRTPHTRTQHTYTQAPHAHRTSRTAATTAHCAIITACTTQHARHTQLGTQLQPPHTPPTQNHTQSHTRPPRHTHVRAVRLPSVDGMLPESWLLYKDKCLQDTRTAIASHHGTRRRRRPQPAARNASRRSA
jgi:hypothetical protein